MEGHVVLAAEKIFQIGFLPITNTLLVAWLTTTFLVVVAVLGTRNVTLIPTSKLQGFLELIIESGYNFIEEMTKDKVKTFFPVITTFFLFILAANWFGLFPGVGTIGFFEEHNHEEIFIPLFRSVNSDLNVTLTLAIISIVIIHIFSVKYLGIGNYLKHWFSLNPVFLFIGLIEIVSEFTKIVSLSFRLFGNIFAGEVMLATIAGIFAFIAPLPFYFLEIIVGLVQAAVFTMLSLVFMVLLTEKHAQENH